MTRHAGRLSGHIPFQPGSPRPPVLAGRDEELGELAERLNDLALNRQAPNLVVYGPRGNGKTSLLYKVAEATRELPGVADPRKVGSVEIVNVSARRLADEFLLCRRIAGKDHPRVVEATMQAKLGGGALPVEGGGTKRTRVEHGSVDMTEAVEERCRKTPMLFIIDEAQILDEAVGSVLLHATQEAQAQGLPFCLVLSGTPRLPAHLHGMQATFFGRTDKVRLGRLDREGTLAALLRPFEDHGVGLPVNGAAFADALESTHDYPYFVQLLGRAIWREARGTDAPRLDDALIGKAMERFERGVADMYEDRYKELKEQGLGAASRAVADAMLRSPSMDLREGDILKAIAGVGGGRDPEDVLAALIGEGFVWTDNAMEPELYEPGIPSLMNYVVRAKGPGTARPPASPRRDGGGGPEC